MAGKIKGITIEIGGDTQPLQKALGDVNKKSRDMQGELKQVERLLKLDPKNTELLAQKQKILAEAVENSREKLNRLKNAQAQVNEQFKKGEINEEQYRAFQREVVKAEQELQGFERQLDATARASKSLGDKMRDAGTKMKSAGETMTKYVTVPLAAAGAGMVAIGKTIDDAYDNIRIGTGATGKALEGLLKDFDEVAKKVPQDFDQISSAVADYNTRLGLSGEALQDLSVQTLNLARLTGGDLSKMIEETSQSFQAFNLPVKDYGDSLDYIFKVSQSTGIGIDRLQQNLVKFAPALKQMGFDFEDSAALMGFFDKAGVEVEQAMMGMNKALVTMAKKGVTDANEALRELFNEIKDAPSDIKATEMAIKVFGAKAGPALASAIREGKMEYQDLVDELKKSQETINGVTAATDDWSEKLLKLKNRVIIAVKPLANEFFDAINKLIDPLEQQMVPLIEDLAEGFSDLPTPAKNAAAAILLIAAAVGPILQGLGMIVIAAPALGPLFVGIGAIITGVFTGLIAGIAGFASMLGTVVGGIATAVIAAIEAIGGAMVVLLANPIGLAIAAVVALVAAFAVLWKTSPKFRQWLRELGQGFEHFLKDKINGFIDDINWLIEQLNKLPKVDIDPINKMLKSSGTMGMADFKQLPGNAMGTDFWRGGLTWVGEKGPELLNLPRGSQIFSNQQSIAAVRNQTVNHTGTVYHVFQTNDRQMVAKIAEEFEKGNRRIPARVATLPSMA